MTLKDARAIHGRMVGWAERNPGKEYPLHSDTALAMIDTYEAEILRLSAILADEILETEGLTTGLLELPETMTSLEEEISKEFKESEEEEY